VLEQLEERTLLTCTIDWDGGGDGSAWADPANWSTDALPGPGDDVCINVAPDPTVTSSGTVSIKSLTSNEHLQIISGTFSVAEASQLNVAFTLSGGTLDAAGSITASGATSWTGGTITGGNFTNTGPMTLSGSAAKILGATARFVNQGTVDHGDTGNLELVANGTSSPIISNLGLYEVSSDADIDWTSGSTPTPLWKNIGTLRKAGGTATTTFDFAFDNPGTLEVLAGTFSFSGTAPSVPQFIGTALTDGDWVVTGGTLDFPGTTNIATIEAATTVSLASGGTFDQLAGLTTIRGSWSLSTGQSFTTAASANVTNLGFVSIDATSTLTINATLSNLSNSSGGQLLVDGTLISSATVTNSLGTIAGSGLIQANVSNSGNI
jgi:hypothetical protein